jgi:23S rRNA (uracil1939-C5)-methyltransferase
MKPPMPQSASAQPAGSRLVDREKLVQIEKPIYGGAFLARIEGKAVFVPLALPGERAQVHIVEDKRGYATAEVDEIVSPAPERIAPACRHFGACGGCHYQHAHYEAQIGFKQTILREILERGRVRAPEEITVLAGNPWTYRNRIRLAFDAAGNAGYRSRRSHAVIPIAECPIAAPLLVKAAQTAAEILGQLRSSSRPTEIALFCDAVETSLLVSVFTANPSKIRFQDFAQALRERIPALKGAELVVEGRAGARGLSSMPRTLEQWGDRSLTYAAAGFDYRVDHGAFFQINRWLVDALVERVAGPVAADHRHGLAWDLFAGVGLFARQLTARFNHVVAVESAPAATAALAHNLVGTHAAAVKATTLDFLRRNRETDRPDLIVVDPPRTGLGAEPCKLLSEIGAPTLFYVSCDPATLARDLRALLDTGYGIQSITLADLFPHTFHMETVVKLRR